MADDWYCTVQGEEFGPLSAEQLRSLASSQRLTQQDRVRRGADGEWFSAAQVRGLFANVPATPSSQAIATRPPQVPQVANPRLSRVHSVAECISAEERRGRLGVVLVNGFLLFVFAIFVLASFGIILLFALVGWGISHSFSELNVRKLQAFGTAASDSQFPQIRTALKAICAQLQIREIPTVIIINASETNAFALRFARKKVIVLLSQTLEGVLDKPEELRFILGHELAHLVLDHGLRGIFERFKPVAYRAARELTCDNCGCVAAGNLESSKNMLKRLGVGNELYGQLNESALIAEARYLNSGFNGWLLRQSLTHPPLGKRIANISTFCNEA